MKHERRIGTGPCRWLLALLPIVLVGCAAAPHGYTLVKPTDIEQATEEIPEDQLLDVGLAISEARTLDEKTLEELGTNEDVRSSERHYVPYQLKNTLQMSAEWGTVQVVPPEYDSTDLLVTTRINDSNGEVMQLEVEVVDALGRRWLRRKYHANGTEEQYFGTLPGERDAYQYLYNTVANDIAEFKRTLTPAEIEEIRTASRLRFAREFAPDAFGDYITEEPSGIEVIRRLPAANDPLMARIDLARERDHLFVDTLNQYYEGLYVNMWEPYEDWRRFNRAEKVALRQQKEQAVLRTIGGIILIAAAIALEMGDVNELQGLGGVMILAGGQVIISGVNVSEQAEIHAEAIEELGDSFGAEMRPTVLDLEGKQYELTGTAQEQYDRWKELLRRIYIEETGFEPDEDVAGGTGGVIEAQPAG